jgi:hypothetical protein
MSASLARSGSGEGFARQNFLLPNRENECVSILNIFGIRVDALSQFHCPLESGQYQEVALSDEHETPASENTAVASADIGALQEQLKSLSAERDRQAFEKSEIIQKANAIARERDDLRARYKSEIAERERLASENSRLTAEASTTAQSLAEATRRADAAAIEIADLRKLLEAAPGADPLLLIWKIIQEKTRLGVAFLRSKIPANHPALPWFDKTVEVSTKVGCLTVQLAVAFAKWMQAEGLPRAKALAKKAMAEIEARLAKK